ncbi:MAG TPA: PDZ domain-containing protein [Novosphingobium sp.]|nr:PDZ domain-containing protein [Novosphingobium sp.]
MRLMAVVSSGLALCVGQTAHANDWEKFYRPIDSFSSSVIDYDGEPEMLNSSGNLDGDIEQMWRKGFAPIGYTSFETGNNKTGDAVRFAKKLKARYLIVHANLQSSRTTSMPLTLPNTTTSYTNGNASAYGSGGYAHGTYSGTTTTYGTKTTYIPITVNRFSKAAIYFQEVPKIGFGVFSRELTPAEMQRLETRHAVAVRFVRDGSPAYVADIFPGDIITKINGLPVGTEVVKAALIGPQPVTLHVDRNGQQKDISVNVPPEWQPK